MTPPRCFAVTYPQIEVWVTALLAKGIRPAATSKDLSMVGCPFTGAQLRGRLRRLEGEHKSLSTLVESLSPTTRSITYLQIVTWVRALLAKGVRPTWETKDLTKANCPWTGRQLDNRLRYVLKGQHESLSSLVESLSTTIRSVTYSQIVAWMRALLALGRHPTARTEDLSAVGCSFTGKQLCNRLYTLQGEHQTLAALRKALQRN